jgi:hypothetical protein
MDHNKNEDSLAGKQRDMGIKTVEGQDNEGHLKGSKKSAFNERSMQEHERRDENELNHLDAREDAKGTGAGGI